MALRLQMGDLVTRCLRQCDKEFDTSISPGEAYTVASESFGEMWLEVAGTGLRYFATTETIVANGSASYLEPSDMLELLGVDHIIDTTSGRRRSLRRRMPTERSRFSGFTGMALEYELVDDQLFLFPRPGNGTYEVLYTPQPTDISTYLATDVVDVVNPHGLGFVKWCFAVKALAKAEKSTDLALAEREAHRVKLVEWAADRVLESARPVVNRELDLHGDCDEGGWWNR